MIRNTALKFIWLVFAGCLVWALLLSLTPVTANAGDVDGQKAFLDSKCNTCHSVEGTDIVAKTKSEKMKGPDLPGDLSGKTDEWLMQYIKKEIDQDGVKHKKGYKGTDEELAAMISWLRDIAAK